MSDISSRVPDFADASSKTGLADLFRQMRRERGLTQKELSTRSGISQPEISRIEQSKIEPTYQRICVLCQALGYQLLIRDVLMSGDDPDLLKTIESQSGSMTILLSHTNKRTAD